MNLKYKDGNSIAEHLSNFHGLLNELSTIKLELDDEVHVLLLLSSLLDNWETLVVSLSNLAPNGMIYVNMVKDNMFNEETRRKELGIFSNTEALVTEKWGISKSKKSSSDYNHNKSREKLKSRKEIKCFYCGKSVYIKRECKKFKNLKENMKNKKRIKTLQQLHLMVIQSLSVMMRV